jgi:hypothetical protein
MKKFTIYLITFHLLLILSFLMFKTDLIKRRITVSNTDTIYIPIKPLYPARPTAFYDHKNTPFYTITLPQIVKIDTFSLYLPPSPLQITSLSHKNTTLRVQYTLNNHLHEAIFHKIPPNFDLFITQDTQILVKSYKEIPKLWVFTQISTDFRPEIGILLSYKRYGLSVSSLIFDKNVGFFPSRSVKIGVFYRVW